MRSRPGQRSCAGLALVIVMLLLALLVLAIFALSVFLRTGGQVVETSLYHTQARQNALLGLQRAIGELQHWAGPDRRATATADLLANRDESKKYWTGVWEGDGSFLGWLVSGDDQNVLTPLGATPTRPLVTLVGQNSAGSTQPAVRVPLDPIEVSATPGSMDGAAVTVGHFGYWVGDEGVKTTVKFAETLDQLDYDDREDAFVPREEETDDSALDDAAKRLRQMMLPRPRIEKITDALDPSDEQTRQALQQIEAYDQIPYAASSSLQLAAHFHDMTVQSLGVLADTADGGLKRDLSDPTAVAPVAGATAAAWMTNRPRSQVGKTARHRIAAIKEGLAVAPFITEFALRFCFYRSGDATAVNGSLQVHCQMQVEVWNPYTSTLEGDGTKRLKIGVKGLPTNLTVTTGSGQTFTGIDLQRAYDHLSFELPAERTWEPGKVAVFYGGDVWSSSAPASTAGNIHDFGLTISGTNSAANRWIEIASPDLGESTSMTVSVFYDGQAVATYDSGQRFSAISPVRNFAWADTTAWMFGYGYAVTDSFPFWADGARATALDPRGSHSGLSGVETGTTLWRTNPVQNAATTIQRNPSGGGTFYAASSAPAYLLFELPRQEVVSLGALQHVPGVRPNEIGNPWGGPANAIFDQAYFSTLPRNTNWQVPPLPLAPNAYLSFYAGKGSVVQADLLDERKAAAHLLIKGAFNVNSTSAKAWRAILGGGTVPADYTITPALRNAFFRHSQSAQENSTSGSKPTGEVTARKQGVRALTDAQVDALGEAVARLNQARDQPYLSLQDFVNSGTLATALDPAASILSGLSETDRRSINDGAVVMRGMPAYVSQADLLTSISPFIATRSDTFRIRVYGDAVNPTDPSRVEARVYGEAVVQRVPDYYDDEQPATEHELNAVNAVLGRRFIVVYFRWLGLGDI